MTRVEAAKGISQNAMLGRCKCVEEGDGHCGHRDFYYILFSQYISSYPTLHATETKTNLIKQKKNGSGFAEERNLINF